MSASEHLISASVMLADYANVDSSGKINIVGGGITSIAIVSDNGMSAPFSVLVNLGFSPDFDGQTFLFGFELVDLNGEPVDLEGPEGKSRIQIVQEMTAGVGSPGQTPVSALREGIPPGVLPGGVRFVVNMSNGLPLPPENFYAWRASLDSQTNPGLQAPFYVKKLEH